MTADGEERVGLERLEALCQTSIYPGLRPFTSKEHHLFFGREAQVRAIADNLGHEGFVAVLGGSGSGKSSIVRAGLEPFLRTEGIGRVGDSWRVVTFTPGVRPMASLVHGLSEIIEGGDGEKDEIARILEEEGSFEAFRKAFHQRFLLAQCPAGEPPTGTQPSAEQNARANLLIVIDQFEEIFRADTEKDEAERLVELMLEARRNREDYRRLFVILTMRSDDLHSCAAYLELPDAINASSFLVRRLNRDELMQAIYAPARNTMLEAALFDGRTMRGDRFAPFDAAVIKMLLDATLAIANDPDHLPLLQHLVAVTWARACRRWIDEATADGGSIAAPAMRVTPDDLAACCGVAAANLNDLGVRAQLLSRGLETSADALLAGLSDTRKEIARAALTRLAHVDDHGLIKREFASTSQLANTAHCSEAELADTLATFERPWPFVRKLAHVGGDAFDVSHESFIRNWRMFRRWLTEEREALDGFDRLAKAIAPESQSSPFARLKGWLIAPDLTQSQFQQSGRFAEDRYDLAWIEGRRREVTPERFGYIKDQLRLAGQWWGGRVYFRNLAIIAVLAATTSWQLTTMRTAAELDAKNTQLESQQEALRETQELLLSLLDVSTWQNAAAANLLDLSSMPPGKQLAALKELRRLNKEIGAFYTDLGALVQGVSDLALEGDEARELIARSGRFALQLRQMEKQTGRTTRHLLGSLALFKNRSSGFVSSWSPTARLLSSSDHVRRCLLASRAGERVSVIDAAVMPEHEDTYIVFIRNAENAGEVMIVRDHGEGPGCREDGIRTLIRTTQLSSGSLSGDGSMLVETVPPSTDQPFAGYRVTRLEWFQTCAVMPGEAGVPCAPHERRWEVIAHEVGVIPAGFSGTGEATNPVTDQSIALFDDPVRLDILPASASLAMQETLGQWPPAEDLDAITIDDSRGEVLMIGETQISGSPNPAFRIAGFDRTEDGEGSLVGYVASTTTGKATRDTGVADAICGGGELCLHFLRIARLGNGLDRLEGNELNVLELSFVGPPIASLRFGQGAGHEGKLFMTFAETGQIGRLDFSRDTHRMALRAATDAIEAAGTDLPEDLCGFHSASYRMLTDECGR